MKQFIAHLALVVHDYDEAIDFYTKKLSFSLIEDTVLTEQKRWVLVAPPGSRECSLLLAKAAKPEQQKPDLLKPERVGYPEKLKKHAARRIRGFCLSHRPWRSFYRSDALDHPVDLLPPRWTCGPILPRDAAGPASQGRRDRPRDGRTFLLWAAGAILDVL